MPLVIPIQDLVIQPLKFHEDHRGWLVELFRNDELLEYQKPVMAYVSETKPGQIRGPHEHRDQTDVFCFFGPGNLSLHLWDARSDSRTYGAKLTTIVGRSNPCMVVVPPGVVHGYKNISDHEALVFNAPNRLFAGHRRAEPVDEIRHENDLESPYRIP